jgi:hypothetical protein
VPSGGSIICVDSCAEGFHFDAARFLCRVETPQSLRFPSREMDPRFTRANPIATRENRNHRLSEPARSKNPRKGGPLFWLSGHRLPTTTATRKCSCKPPYSVNLQASILCLASSPHPYAASAPLVIRKKAANAHKMAAEKVKASALIAKKAKLTNSRTRSK